MADFLIAYNLTKRNEGGWNNVEGDRGGETYCGISRVNFPNWSGWTIIDQRNPKHGEIYPDLDPMVQEFYIQNFWNPIGGDQLDQDIANKVYDTAVNVSVERALLFLKQSL